MPIDGCLHQFQALAGRVLPGYMRHLKRAIPIAPRADDFIARGGLPEELASHLKRARDFSGCYVFLRGTRPTYVGISRKVRSRIRQHIRGRSHFEATLAYRMACRGAGRLAARAKNMQSPAFMRRFKRAKRALAKHRVACIVIRNPLELYLFEAYAAMVLNTARWNTFETH